MTQRSTFRPGASHAAGDPPAPGPDRPRFGSSLQAPARRRPLLLRVRTAALPWVLGAASLCQAADGVDQPEHGAVRYAIGPTFTSAWGGIDHPLQVRPSAGIAYGRWKFGSIPSDQWLQFSGLFKEPAVSYEALRTERRNVGLSLRLHDLERQETRDTLPSGNTTIRGRAIFSYVLDEHWGASAEVTQDLQNRGDGTTLSGGLVRGVNIGGQQRLFFSGSLTWATGEHWTTVYRDRMPPGDRFGSTLGSIGVGVTWRHWIDETRVFWISFSVARPISDIARVVDPQLQYRSEFGVKWIGRFRLTE